MLQFSLHKNGAGTKPKGQPLIFQLLRIVI